MAKTKPKSIVKVADGAGGMMKLEDHRFEKEAWPINIEVPMEGEQAEEWLRYLQAECGQRGWSMGQLAQLECRENSGNVTVMSGGKALLDIVWERRRSGPLSVRARPGPGWESSPLEAERFLGQVNERCRNGATQPIYARGTLQYKGRAWDGELWLDDKIRLGPASLRDRNGTEGAGVLHVDAMLDCIGQTDVPRMREELLMELSFFLSVILQTAVRLPDCGRTWTWAMGTPGCELRELGYMETANPLTMPLMGTDKPIRLHPVDNPRAHLDENWHEISVRADMCELWTLYRGLPASTRRQFLQAAAKWQEALMHWPHRSSLSFALMVVACEALKPRDADDPQNCYHVIEALLGKSTAQRLQQHHVFAAQRVRSTHLHTGEFHGSELVRVAFMSSYEDPSFGEALREMARVTPAAIIEWLRRRGDFDMPAVRRRKTMQRRIKENALVVIPAMFGIGVAFGWMVCRVL
jgi:hypothetical protein